MRGVMHILGHPLLPLKLARHAEDSQLFNCWNFCKLAEKLELDYCYYGLADSELPPGTHGTLMSLADYGKGPWEYRNLFHKRYNAALSAALAQNWRKNAAPQWVASIYGVAQSDIEVPPDALLFEPMVGYGSCWTHNRVFPSQAQRNAIYASQRDAQSDAQNDAVIPHFVDPAEYDFSAATGRYLLYLGRNNPNKGVAIAQETAKQSALPYRGVFSGCHGAAKRKLLSGARAVLMPTRYPEPFGYVAIEAMLSGTPVIASDWGAFPEIIQQGVTGWCCNTQAEFTAAAEKAATLDRAAIRAYAIKRFTIDAVADAYRKYLEFLLTLKRKSSIEAK
jgi:glycosyltransferase involved in cell wall biosynthesis